MIRSKGELPMEHHELESSKWSFRTSLDTRSRSRLVPRMRSRSQPGKHKSKTTCTDNVGFHFADDHNSRQNLNIFAGFNFLCTCLNFAGMFGLTQYLQSWSDRAPTGVLDFAFSGTVFYLLRYRYLIKVNPNVW